MRLREVHMPYSLWNEIERWVLQGIEGTKVEMKREFALADRPSRARFAKLITAIANAPGGTGYFIIGVVDKKDRRGTHPDDVYYGVTESTDHYQRSIQQALQEFSNPIPNVTYHEVTPPGTDKTIGVVIIDRSRNKPHEVTHESDTIKPGIYIKRGAETFLARREDILTMTGGGRTQAIIVNFTHPITEVQQKQIEDGTNLYISEVVQPSKVPIHFTETEPFENQVNTVVDEIGLTDEQWQELYILVNVPGFATIAAPLIAELHGRMGHFPKVIRLKRAQDDASRYDFEEVIQLQRIRDTARARRQNE